MKSKPNTKQVKMQAGTGPDNIRDCRTPCLGAFVIIPMMVHAKSSRCRIYAVRKAASCDMLSRTEALNPFHVPEPCYRELNQCEPQPKSFCSGRFEPAGLCPTARKEVSPWSKCVIEGFKSEADTMSRPRTGESDC